MDDNKLPAGYIIQKIPCCDNCVCFEPRISDMRGRTLGGKWTSAEIVCEYYSVCCRAYEIGRNEKAGDK